MIAKYALPALFAFWFVCLCGLVQAQPPVDYETKVRPILQNYCAGCHSDDDSEGDFSVSSFASMMKGSEHGVVLIPGDVKSSLMARVLTGQAKFKMPPEGETQPEQAEIDTLLAWIAGGAQGPDGEEPRYTKLNVPAIEPLNDLLPSITDVAYAPDGASIAIARYRQVDLVDAQTLKTIRSYKDHEGKVNRVLFSQDGQWLLTGSGIVGLKGTVTIFEVATGDVLQKMEGHSDVIYGVALSHDKTLMATSSYDRAVLVWNVAEGKIERSLTGHNGAIYDVAFNNDAQVLVSASADDTLKLWSPHTGQRLDTLGQPLLEQFVARFSPDDRFIFGAGRDNRIRQWRLVSKTVPKINPLINARYAHEQPIVDLACSRDSKILVSSSEDLSIKIWNARNLQLLGAYENQPAIGTAVDISPDANQIAVGRLDGSFELIPLKRNLSDVAQEDAENQVVIVDDAQSKMDILQEVEPNNSSAEAQSITIPAKVSGLIFSDKQPDEADADYFAFDAKAGEQFMLETNAARQKSPLDTKVEVLDAEGNAIPRVVLQAVRDSYFTFRGKDSTTSDDFRVHNWEEMEINELLYADGEVVKLWHYPRGPDSGFRVYPGQGSRWNYFDTTAYAHALQAPCYIVVPHPPGVSLTPNGLPDFTIYYENDDEATRKWGDDSQLLFTAPADGRYIARLSDVRGFAGADFNYEFTIRHAQPGFKVSLNGANSTIRPGSAQEFTLRADRHDGFEGEIRVEIDGLPPGFYATSPVVIQAGQLEALGNIYADADAPPPTAENAQKSKLIAKAVIHGKEVVADVNAFGEFKLGPAPRVKLRLARENETWEQAQAYGIGNPLELTIAPGEMIAAKVFSERNNYNGLIDFGKDDAGRGLPHGVFVDNIGLNGLMIRENENERTFYITAAKWVPEQTRLFYLRGNNVDGECSIPVILHVR
jgi:hypothetical protein